jgi:hypothetical protein
MPTDVGDPLTRFGATGTRDDARIAPTIVAVAARGADVTRGAAAGVADDAAQAVVESKRKRESRIST